MWVRVELGRGWTPRGPHLDATLDRRARGGRQGRRETARGRSKLVLGLWTLSEEPCTPLGSTGICRAGPKLRVFVDECVSVGGRHQWNQG